MSLRSIRLLVLIAGIACAAASVGVLGTVDRSSRWVLAVAASCSVLAFLPVRHDTLITGAPPATGAAPVHSTPRRPSDPGRQPPMLGRQEDALPTPRWDGRCARCAEAALPSEDRPTRHRRGRFDDVGDSRHAEDASMVDIGVSNSGGSVRIVRAPVHRGIAVVGIGPVTKSHFRALIAALRDGSCPHAVVRVMGEPIDDPFLVSLDQVDVRAWRPMELGTRERSAVAVRTVPGPGGRSSVSGCVVWARTGAARRGAFATVEMRADGCHADVDGERFTLSPVLAALAPE